MKQIIALLIGISISGQALALAPLAERKATLAACREQVSALETSLGQKPVKMRSNKQCASKLKGLQKKSKVQS